MSRPFRPWPLQDELEREYEHAPANERPLFPPSSLPTFPHAHTSTGSPLPAGEATETTSRPTPPAAGVSVITFDEE